MEKVRGVFASHLRQRPFDIYVAMVIFLAGAYALLSPIWPENYHQPNAVILINVISIYMMIASSIIMIGLLCNRQKRPIFSVLAEMWGWFSISSASFAITLMYVAQLIYLGSEQLSISIILGLIWFGMSIASGIRSLDIFLAIKGLGR